MPNKWLLLITDSEAEKREDEAALLEAGYAGECILTTTGEEAAEYLRKRLTGGRSARPGIIIVDLDHAQGEARERLRRLMRTLKEDPEYRKIPLVMLMRPDKREDVTEWYRAGVNAVALRPNSEAAAAEFYTAVRIFWHGTVLLPEPEWTSHS